MYALYQQLNGIKWEEFLEEKFALRSQFLSGLSGLEILELEQFERFADYMFAS